MDELIELRKLHYVESAKFNFLVPLNLYKIKKPYLSRLPSGSDLQRTNIMTEGHLLKVFDVSGHENLFSLDKSGFQFVKLPVQDPQWTDNYVLSEYIPKMEEWLVQHFKCSSSFVYAYSVILTTKENTIVLC